MENFKEMYDSFIAGEYKKHDIKKAPVEEVYSKISALPYLSSVHLTGIIAKGYMQPFFNRFLGSLCANVWFKATITDGLSDLKGLEERISADTGLHFKGTEPREYGASTFHALDDGNVLRLDLYRP